MQRTKALQGAEFGLTTFVLLFVYWKVGILNWETLGETRIAR